MSPEQAATQTYAELLAFVASQPADYRTTAEYAAIYPVLAAKYASEGHQARRAAIRRWRADVKRATIETGCPVGLFL